MTDYITKDNLNGLIDNYSRGTEDNIHLSQKSQELGDKALIIGDGTRQQARHSSQMREQRSAAGRDASTSAQRMGKHNHLATTRSKDKINLLRGNNFSHHPISPTTKVDTGDQGERPRLD